MHNCEWQTKEFSERIFEIEYVFMKFLLISLGT